MNFLDATFFGEDGMPAPSRSLAFFNRLDRGESSWVEPRSEDVLLGAERTSGDGDDDVLESLDTQMTSSFGVELEAELEGIWGRDPVCLNPAVENARGLPTIEMLLRRESHKGLRARTRYIC